MSVFVLFRGSVRTLKSCYTRHGTSGSTLFCQINWRLCRSEWGGWYWFLTSSLASSLTTAEVYDISVIYDLPFQTWYEKCLTYFWWVYLVFKVRLVQSSAKLDHETSLCHMFGGKNSYVQRQEYGEGGVGVLVVPYHHCVVGYPTKIVVSYLCKPAGIWACEPDGSRMISWLTYWTHMFHPSSYFDGFLDLFLFSAAIMSHFGSFADSGVLHVMSY